MEDMREKQDQTKVEEEKFMEDMREKQDQTKVEEEEKFMEDMREKQDQTKVEEKFMEDTREKQDQSKVEEEEEEEEVLMMEVEPKTGVSFPTKLADGKHLNAVGLRRKKLLGLRINIYAFGIYGDNDKLKELLKAKFGQAPEKPTKELYEAVIDSDVWMMVRMSIVFGGLTMNMVRINFDEGLGGSIMKLNGGQKNTELANKVLGCSVDNMKLSRGSQIDIARLPGYVLQSKVKDELINEVESELLCRAYIHMYLGDDPFDKEAKERFGALLLSLF
ncbi:chalcone isomerase-like protein 1 [Typha latifolia]|uniref:chalcone isomerase-like protein 1 n=1 Tax=Typha latifolia TaxID=4733 RepID=UPI003C2E976B